MHDFSSISRLVAEKKWQEVREAFSHLHASEAAELLLTMEAPVRALVYRTLQRKFAAKVFAYLEPHQQTELLEDLSNHEINTLLTHLSPDDRTDLFEELPAKVTKKLLMHLNREDLEEVRQLLGYPEDSVGRAMTPDYVSVRPHLTVAQAFEHIRRFGRDKETVDVIYVIGEDGKLEGYFKVRQLLLADPSEIIGNIPRESTPSLSAFDDQEEAVRRIQKYNLSALPVTDSEGVLIGIVTVDDLIDVAEEEATEDFHKIAGISVGEGDTTLTNIAQASIKLLFRKRITWLVLLVGVSIISAEVIAGFEKVIASSVALVFFLPLLIGSGGNAGSQAATLMVRALGVGDVKLSDWGKLIIKEVTVAGALGFAMALAVSFVSFFRAGPEIAVIVSSSMILIVLMGSLIGMSLPFLLARFKFDPATASGPLVTSVADVVGVFIYFSFASWYLGVAV